MERRLLARARARTENVDPNEVTANIDVPLPLIFPKLPMAPCDTDKADPKRTKLRAETDEPSAQKSRTV
jgi:hypothetical protein